MGHILNTLPPLTQVLLILGTLLYATTQFFLDRERMRWRKRCREEAARRDSAESANRAKAYFLTTMSHEIRAPLNAIVGFTELALKTPLNPELREYLGTVRASAEWLTHVANEIVDFSRMEAGVIELSKEVFSVREIVRSAINIAQPMADARKLPLRFHLDAALPNQVQGDSTRLLQVIYNLIENAVKFTTSGNILVSAVVEHRGADTVTVRISVADTGLGIAPERVKHLFEPLTAPTGSLDRRARTCGFGLPICQRVVQMMGGEIAVQSRPGMGSTFSFTLSFPLVSQEQSAAEVAKTAAAEAKRLQILVADDNAASRLLVTVLLQQTGHHVMEAGNGLEALKLFTAGNFDLVLMDVEMPELNGVEATKAIRATEPAGRCTPIYALTAHALETDKERCMRAGMTGFLSKPVNVETLMNLVAAIGAASANAKATYEASSTGGLLDPASTLRGSACSLPARTGSISLPRPIPATPPTLSPEANTGVSV